MVWATYSTWEAIFLTVAVVAMATIKASTITTGGSTTIMEDFTTTITTMVDFTITTTEASARVSRVITDANASTASHSAIGILVDCHLVIKRVLNQSVYYMIY